jgi:hypothetical protein
MPEGSEVTLHRLPKGDVHRGVERSWSGRFLELELDLEADELGIGCLVEIEGVEAIYLGEIQKTRGSRLWVEVEHRVDRAKLARIQELWHEADGGPLKETAPPRRFE